MKIFVITAVIFCLFSIQPIYAKEVRTYRAYIDSEPSRDSECIWYFLLDKSGKMLTSKYKGAGGYVSDHNIPLVYCKDGDLKKEVKICLDNAYKNKYPVEVSGSWDSSNSPDWGFDYRTVTCKKVN